MWNKKYDHEERIYCPVCGKDKFLGIRQKDEFFQGHCEDCRAMYFWHPLKDTPISMLDKDKDKDKGKCGCLSCAAKGR